MSYGSVAARVRENKERHPENFCSHPGCLWRTQTRDGFKRCPKHESDLLNCIEKWFDALANSEGVLACEYKSHVIRVAAEFNITEDEAARLYNKLIAKWEAPQLCTR